MLQARQLAWDSVLEKIASEYLERRQEGETMDQIRDRLYKHYSISTPVEFWMGYFNPIPFGNLTLAAYARNMPEDALRLGEITYTISCHRALYPPPCDGQGPRDSACEYDAMTRICSRCKVQMVILEATTRKVDPDLWEMMRKWSALEGEISAAADAWESRQPS